MTNEEFLTASEEFLQVDPACRIQAFTPASMLAIVREFATAVDPFPLEEVMEQEIKVFLDDNKQTIPARPHRVNKELARTEKLFADLRSYEYKYAMTCLRWFLPRPRFRLGPTTNKA
jgi:hypothetical protein